MLPDSDKNFVWKKLAVQTSAAPSGPSADEARAAGYEAGLKEGRDAARSELDAKLSLLGESVAQFDEEKARLEREALEASVALAREVFEHLFRVELGASAALLNRLVDVMNDSLDATGELTLQLAQPCDIEGMDQLGFNVETVPQLGPGEVRLKCDGGLIGINVAEALDQVFGASPDP